MRWYAIGLFAGLMGGVWAGCSSEPPAPRPTAPKAAAPAPAEVVVFEFKADSARKFALALQGKEEIRRSGLMPPRLGASVDGGGEGSIELIEHAVHGRVMRVTAAPGSRFLLVGAGFSDMPGERVTGGWVYRADVEYAFEGPADARPGFLWHSKSDDVRLVKRQKGCDIGPAGSSPGMVATQIIPNVGTLTNGQFWLAVPTETASVCYLTPDLRDQTLAQSASLLVKTFRVVRTAERAQP